MENGTAPRIDDDSLFAAKGRAVPVGMSVGVDADGPAEIAGASDAGQPDAPALFDGLSDETDLQTDLAPAARLIAVAGQSSVGEILIFRPAPDDGVAGRDGPDHLPHRAPGAAEPSTPEPAPGLLLIPARGEIHLPVAVRTGPPALIAAPKPPRNYRRPFAIAAGAVIAAAAAGIAVVVSLSPPPPPTITDVVRTVEVEPETAPPAAVPPVQAAPSIPYSPATIEEAPQRPPRTAAPSAPPQPERPAAAPAGDALTADGIVPQPADKPRAPALPAEPPAAAGRYLIQIASLPARSAAREQIEKLRPKLAGIVHADRYRIRTATLSGGRRVFRVTVEGFGSLGPATRLCRQLRARKETCLVVRVR